MGIFLRLKGLFYTFIMKEKAMMEKQDNFWILKIKKRKKRKNVDG